MIISSNVKKIVEQALYEDIPAGDLTTEALVPNEKNVKGYIIAKEDFILAGIDVAQYVFTSLDPTVEFQTNYKDGQKIKNGDIIVKFLGKAQTILSAERVALNFLGRLSGIATLTSEYVKKVKNYKVKIVDTRKTTPGLRSLEKYAVRAGGGYNHRFGLSDGILIKDNHIKAVGSIYKAVRKAKEKLPHILKIEVEAQTLEEVREALEAKTDIIMLDNMDYKVMKEGVELINGRAIVEASGNVTLDNVADIAATGVDLISVGALTHSAKTVDISLKFEQ